MASDKPLEPWELADKLERKAKVALKGLGGSGRPVGVSLCFRCKHSMVYRRANDVDHEYKTYCLELGEEMPNNIVECSRHAPITQLTLGEMSEMAVMIDDQERGKGHYL